MAVLSLGVFSLHDDNPDDVTTGPKKQRESLGVDWTGGPEGPNLAFSSNEFKLQFWSGDTTRSLVEAGIGTAEDPARRRRNWAEEEDGLGIYDQ
jgi:hypothetical protein